MNRERYKNIYKSRKDILFDNFLGGIAWGLGVTLGLALVFSIMTFALKQLHVVPYIGNFAAQITTYVEEHTQKPNK